MQDDEVADVFENVLHLPIIFLALGRIEAPIGKQREQLADPALDEVNAGRFERFDETARKPKRHNILVPRKAAHSGGEREMPRRRQRIRLEIRKQQLLRLFPAEMRARINQPIAHAVLQRDAPLPATRARGRAGEGVGRTWKRARHGYCAIAQQPFAPVDVAGAQFLLDQQTAKTGAVDEQLTLNRLPAGESDGLDVSGFAIEARLDDLALDAPHALALRLPAQELRI